MLQKSNHSRRWTWCDLHPTEFLVFRPSLMESLITGCLCMLGENLTGAEVWETGSMPWRSFFRAVWPGCDFTTSPARDQRLPRWHQAGVCAEGRGFASKESCVLSHNELCVYGWCLSSRIKSVFVFLSGHSHWKCAHRMAGVCLVKPPERLGRWNPLHVAFPRNDELLEVGWWWALAPFQPLCASLTMLVWMFSPGVL